MKFSLDAVYSQIDQIYFLIEQNYLSIEQMDFSIEEKDFSIGPTGFLERTLTCLTGEALSHLASKLCCRISRIPRFTDFSDSSLGLRRIHCNFCKKLVSPLFFSSHTTLLITAFPTGFHFSSLKSQTDPKS